MFQEVDDRCPQSIRPTISRRCGGRWNTYPLQTSSNDNYTDIKLYCPFHIEYKDTELITIKKAPTITCPIRYFQGQSRYRFNMVDS